VAGASVRGRGGWAWVRRRGGGFGEMAWRRLG
jgi:hypothetical protein